MNPPPKPHRVYPPLLERARELRHPQTEVEQQLWRLLRNRRLASYKFRRQHPIERFIVDLFCHQCALIVEVDGPLHASQAEYDQARTEWLNNRGYTVIRFSNDQVLQQPNAVLEAIFKQCEALTLSPGKEKPEITSNR